MKTELEILNEIRSNYGSLWQKDDRGNPTFEVTVEIANYIYTLLEGHPSQP